MTTPPPTERTLREDAKPFLKWGGLSLVLFLVLLGIAMLLGGGEVGSGDTAELVIVLSVFPFFVTIVCAGLLLITTLAHGAERLGVLQPIRDIAAGISGILGELVDLSSNMVLGLGGILLSLAVPLLLLYLLVRFVKWAWVG